MMNITEDNRTIEQRVKDTVWSFVSTDEQHDNLLKSYEYDYEVIDEMLDDALFNFTIVHAHVFGEDKNKVSEVNLDSVSLCADNFYSVQSTLNYLKLNDYDFIGMLERLSNVINSEQTDDNILDDGISALFGEDFECAVHYKSNFNSSRWDEIEQMAIETANEARQMRLEMLERGLDEIREGLLLDIMQEFSEEDSIRIGEIILKW